MYNNFISNYKVNESLTEEELLKLFIEYRNGNKDAFEKIILSNIGLVINRVKFKFSRTGYNTDDLINIGILGLIKSINTFDTDRKIKFSSYSVRCIDNEILMFLRKNSKYLYAISIDAKYDDDKGDYCTIGDFLEDKNKDFTTAFEINDQYMQIRQIIEELDDVSKEILKLYFGFYDRVYHQNEIAEMCGFSQSYVSRILKKSIKILKQKLIKNKVIDRFTDKPKIKQVAVQCK